MSAFSDVAVYLEDLIPGRALSRRVQTAQLDMERADRSMSAGDIADALGKMRAARGHDRAMSVLEVR